MRYDEDDTRSRKKRATLEVSWRQIVDRLKLAGKNVLLVMPPPSGRASAAPHIQGIGADVIISHGMGQSLAAVTQALTDTDTPLIDLPGLWTGTNGSDICVHRPAEEQQHGPVTLCNYSANRHIAGTMRLPKIKTDEARQLLHALLDCIEHINHGLGEIKLIYDDDGMTKLTIG